MFSSEFKQPLSEVVDQAIMGCKFIYYFLILFFLFSLELSVFFLSNFHFFSFFLLPLFHQVQLIQDVDYTKILCCLVVPQCLKILVEDYKEI